MSYVINSITYPETQFLGQSRVIRTKTISDIVGIQKIFLKTFAELRSKHVVLDNPSLIKLSGYDTSQNENKAILAFEVAKDYHERLADFDLYKIPSCAAFTCNYNGPYLELPKVYAALQDFAGSQCSQLFSYFIDEFHVGVDLGSLLAGNVHVTMIQLARPIENYIVADGK